MDQLPRLGKRELICLLLFTCNYVVSVWRYFLFLWVLGMGYVILLWHSLSLLYNHFGAGDFSLFILIFDSVRLTGQDQFSMKFNNLYRTNYPSFSKAEKSIIRIGIMVLLLLIHIWNCYCDVIFMFGKIVQYVVF